MVVTFSQIEGVLVIVIPNPEPKLFPERKEVVVTEEVPMEGDWEFHKELNTPNGYYEIEVAFQNGILYPRVTCERDSMLFYVNPLVVRQIFKRFSKQNGFFCEEINSSYYKVTNTIDTHLS